MTAKYIIIASAISIFTSHSLKAQDDPYRIDNVLHNISTLINIEAGNRKGNGTGFFFQEFGAQTEDKQYSRIDSVWLITNRHVVFTTDNNGKEYLPDKLTFHLRRKTNSNDKSKPPIEWLPIELSQAELANRLRLHPNKQIDIVAISVFDLLRAELFKSPDIIGWNAVTEKDMPGMDMIDVEVTSDVITVGYPYGYYDDFNVFPIVKSGVISSRWGMMFKGLPIFLIDSKLFPGSSGSIVISKPANIVTKGQDVLYSENKRFVFLGVYSGEPFMIANETFESRDFIITKKNVFDIGIVWYPHLVVEIVKHGNKFVATP